MHGFGKDVSIFLFPYPEGLKSGAYSFKYIMFVKNSAGVISGPAGILCASVVERQLGISHKFLNKSHAYRQALITKDLLADQEVQLGFLPSFLLSWATNLS